MSMTIRLPNATFGPGGHRLFRDINRRVRELVDGSDDEGCFFCECVDESCAAVLRMSGAEYDALCHDLGCYAVLPGHDDRELDTVVGRNDRYVLVRFEEPAREAASPHGDGVEA
jgi:hypothetical protein